MRVFVVAVIAGCSFHPPGESPDAPGSGDAPTVTSDAPAADTAAIVVPCSAPDPSGLVACFEVEDGVADGVLADSSPDRQDATTAGLTPAMRGSSHAATVGAAAATYVAQAADLDRAAGYTLAMWIRPHALPADGTAQGLLDHEQQYAMALVTTGGAPELHCIHTGVDFEYTAMAAVNQWTFVACTWDGQDLCAHRWTSASIHGGFCHGPAPLPAATGSHGVAIGHLSNNGAPLDRFDGDFDSVQIYTRALTRDELCAVAGQPARCL